MTRATPERPASKDRSPWRRRLTLGRAAALLGVLAVVGVIALWIAVNRVAWLGPYVADGLRAVIGTDAVASLEDFAYRVQDRVNRVWRRGEKPRAYWSVPSAAPVAAAPASAPSGSAVVDGEAAPPVIAPFAPAAVGPVHKAWSAPGDGEWLMLPDEDHPDEQVAMAKTLLHPDKTRSWAEVFVVAIDLRRTRIHLLPGKQEPVATEEAALGMVRPGSIPEEHRGRVIAAFNGGFKTEHGQYGMFTQGTLLIKPKTEICTIAAYADDTVRLATWDKLSDSQANMVWWRQTPACMYEDGKLHWKLADAQLAKKWGATLDGETVIRRSAMGIDAKGETLYMAISNHTTARVIADGLHHAGAVAVAQLDVNFSYPKFVTFRKKGGEGDDRDKRVAIPLADGFEFSEDEYIRAVARRDFFYVMPRAADERTALTGKDAAAK